MDADLITQCADPQLKPAIIEQFVEEAGSADPLSITVRSGDRLILVPKAHNEVEAQDIVRRYVGRAVVRVGLTQYPAGLGLRDSSVLSGKLVDPCENLRMGTALFSKVIKLVSRWYGEPNGKEAENQILFDAIEAWKSGEFAGDNVFRAANVQRSIESPANPERSAVQSADFPEPQPSAAGAKAAPIRIDLKAIAAVTGP